METKQIAREAFGVAMKYEAVIPTVPSQAPVYTPPARTVEQLVNERVDQLVAARMDAINAAINRRIAELDSEIFTLRAENEAMRASNTKMQDNLAKLEEERSRSATGVCTPSRYGSYCG
jgi:hypothetical protein